MSVTRVTEQGWGSRIGASIKGILVGGVLVIGGPVLLFWNEGRAVHRAQALAEGSGAVVEARADAVDAGKEGKLVHVTGTATTAETLADPMFGVKQNALALSRKVEMYQWKQTEERKERKKLGGGTETVTTYNYSKEWTDEPQDSASFEEKAGHENPSFPFRSDAWRASDVRLGAFKVAPELASQLDKAEDVSVGQAELQGVSTELQGKLKPANGGFYMGADAATPAIGDVRVSFSAVRPAAASFVAAQNAGTLQTYHTHAGGDLALVEYGSKTAAEMFQAAKNANTVMTWVLRLVGFLVVFGGLRALFAPLGVLADVVPLFGRVVGFGLGFAAFLLAAPISLVTIAIGWFFYRPLLAVVLFAAAAGIAVFFFMKLRKQAPAMGTAPSFVPPPPPAPAT